MTATKPEIRAALGELVALAVAVRPDWTADDVQAALVDARTCGWSWAHAFVAMARLIVDPDAKPGELVPPHPDPQRAPLHRPGSAESAAELLAEARELCDRASAKLRAAEQTKTITGDPQ